MTRYSPLDSIGNLVLGDAFGPRSHPLGQALLRVLAADAVSIAIAVFALSWFAASLVSAAGQL